MGLGSLLGALVGRRHILLDPPPTFRRSSISSRSRCEDAPRNNAWDGDRVWSPTALWVHQPSGGCELVVYYAGNVGNYRWWGANTSIGHRVFVWKSDDLPPDVYASKDVSNLTTLALFSLFEM